MTLDCDAWWLIQARTFEIFIYFSQKFTGIRLCARPVIDYYYYLNKKIKRMLCKQQLEAIKSICFFSMRFSIFSVLMSDWFVKWLSPAHAFWNHQKKVSFKPLKSDAVKTILFILFRIYKFYDRCSDYFN